MNCFCCISFMIVCVVIGQDLTPCITPNGETATCVTLLKCKVLIQAVGSTEPLVMQFFKESICNDATSSVCCGTTGNYTGVVTTVKPINKHEIFDTLSVDERKKYVAENLLPSKKFCGMQHTDDYFYNKTETSVDEFPWLVYIIKSKWDHDRNFYLRVESNCVGVLISNQYVLSSISCYIYAGATRSSHNVEMILGVHHVHKTVNCIGTPYGVDDCTDPSIRITSTQWNIYDDFVLFRLPKKIDYSDYIRPICLPLQPDEIPAAGSLVLASGWGEETLVKGKRLKLKKRMKYTVMNNKDCRDSGSQRVVICGIPVENNTHHFCTGDFGGPLMYRYKEQNWLAVGLTYQRDDFICDEAQPVTAIQFSPEIISWILENIWP